MTEGDRIVEDESRRLAGGDRPDIERWANENTADLRRLAGNENTADLRRLAGNENTADLRRLAGQVTSLTDLDAAAGVDLDRLHEALADPDAAALPGLLAETRRHPRAHPDLADRIDAVRSDADRVRRQTQERRDRRSRAH